MAEFQKSPTELKKKTAREIVTPLCNLTYSMQLRIKSKEVRRVAKKLFKQMEDANVPDAAELTPDKIVRPVRQ